MHNQDVSKPSLEEIKLPLWQNILTGAQMLFVAFGALVLVPLVTGLDPNVALFTAGLGTLIFHLVTKNKVPVFLASSFAFIGAIQVSVKSWGIPVTMGALMASGVVFMLFGGLIKVFGRRVIEKLLPPVVTGPIIAVIGLMLAPVAVNMALGKGGAVEIPYATAIFVSMVSLITTLIVSIWAKGIFKLIPILLGIAVGYTLSIFMGLVDFSTIAAAPWFAIPNFTAPQFEWQAIIFMLPVVIAPVIEHVGDIMAIGSVTKKDFTKSPGLHRTLTGDGLATSAAAFFGGPPCITYAEVIGAVTLTRNFNPLIMVFAGVWAVAFSFIGKIGAFLLTIPSVVMGGIMVLLFGSIASVGINILVKNRVDLSIPRNLCIVSVVLIFGIGGMLFNFGEFTLQGISLCGITAIILNLILPQDKVGKTIDPRNN